DPARKRLAVILVNFTDRYGVARNVTVNIPGLPAELAGGFWREWTIDAAHSNAWNDAASAALTRTRSGHLEKAALTWSGILPANSVTMLEIAP
ncbi:MAG TPA: hypothetical protein VHM91_22880, partial [Verrucomicrobiales bacterium]|nr:hypothetical protein [Verrucomicrobiales bacterium]